MKEGKEKKKEDREKSYAANSSSLFSTDSKKEFDISEKNERFGGN